MRALILVLATTGPAMADSVVALNTIAAGTLIAAEDLIVVPDDLPGAAARVDEAAGMTAAGMIYAGQAVRHADLMQPLVVERNALVTLIYAQGPLRIETPGRALDAAPGGGLVRVMNLGSRNIVMGTVTGPGTVTIGETG
jgi:flagella basal body P-ring formation protein FlgA